MWPYIQFPNHIPTVIFILDRKIEPVNKKEKIKDYKLSNTNQLLGNTIDVYV